MRQTSLACLLLTLHAVAGCATDSDSPPLANARTINVVRSWPELESQPKITVGEVTARLGIEAPAAPHTSGVLIYCLTDGYALPSDWDPTGRLGPFTVDVRHEDDTRGAIRSVGKTGRSKVPDIRRKTALFRRTITFSRPGTHRVRVLSSDGTVIAQTEIKATGDKGHPWMPLAPDAVAKPLTKRATDRFDAVGHVTNRARGIAVPRYDGMSPLVRDDMHEQALGDPLPWLFPDPREEGWALKLKAVGRDLLVESRKRIIVARPDWHFLARWWINGKPFVPEQLGAFSDENGVLIFGKRLLLRMDFDPQKLGAKSGDQVDVQLLYCRDGWRFTGLAEMLEAHADFDGPELLLSNRTRLNWEASP